ncbi:MAG: hypothetical protein SFZ23_10630 [Planctomycetota bacterium]|nr:hypothetical protein [Planctomycetota bacterium]
MRLPSIGLAAGLAVSFTCASANTDVAIHATALPVPLESYSGSFPPVSEYLPAGLIYSNAPAAGGTVFRNTLNPTIVTDDVSIDPGNAATDAELGGTPQLITGIAIGFFVLGTTGQTRDFDVLVDFQDTYNAAAPANVAAWSSPLTATPIRLTFRNVGQNAAYTSDLVSLANLPGGGVQTTDRGFGVELRFVEPGTTTPVTGVLVTPAFFENALPTGANTQTNGHGGWQFWRDADNDGIIEVSDTRNFAWPTYGRLVLNLRGSVICPGDFNRDGQADFFDYLDFSIAFDAGCD